MVVVLGVSVALAVPVSSHARTDRYVYSRVESVWNWCNCPILNPTWQDLNDVETPAGHVVWSSGFAFTPSGRRSTINVDDVGMLDGDEVRVRVGTEGALIFDECVPVRSTRTITGTTAGRRVWVSIMNVQSPWDRRGCSGLPTAGVATITGVL